MSTGMSEAATKRQQIKGIFRTVLERNINAQEPLLILILVSVFGYLQAIPNTISVAILLLLAGQQYYRRLDQGLPLLQLANLIAVLQWLVGPAIVYQSQMSFDRYSMYVPENVYFAYAIPGTCFYSIGMLCFGLFANQQSLLFFSNRSYFVQYGSWLFAIALLAELASSRAPSSVLFFFHLLSQLRYVAAIYFLLSPSRNGLIYATVAGSALFVRSASSGMFHDLLLWASILFAFWFSKRQWTHQVKASMLLLACMFIFSIQAMKQEYREQLKKGLEPSVVTMPFEFLAPGGKAWSPEVLSLAAVRLNQGWIVSAVMNNVPKNTPYAEGETISDALIASGVPRFLLQNKATAGGRTNFRRFTGLQILDSTSMCICVLGEAYANFGPEAGILFMALVGLLFSTTFSALLRFTVRHPDFLFWIPLIFYQAMKAETDLVVILNQVTKGTIVAVGGYFAMHMAFPVVKHFFEELPGHPRKVEDGFSEKLATKA